MSLILDDEDDVIFALDKIIKMEPGNTDSLI